MKKKMIRLGLTLSFALLVLCHFSVSGAKVIESSWAATPVMIDGSGADWEGVAFTEYKPTKADYAFRNDAENLYVLFVFKEPREFMSSIRDTGMTVWLNTEGKNRKDYGIRFMIKTVSAEDYIVIYEEMAKIQLTEEQKTKIKSKKAYQVFHNEVIDKDGEPVQIVSGPAAPAFNTAGGGETVSYEFKIPLKKDETHPVGIGTDPGNTIKVGFEWGGSTPEMRQDKLANQTSQGVQGQAESGTSSATGERGVSGSSLTGGLGSMARLRSPKYIFWSEVQLADNR